MLKIIENKSKKININGYTIREIDGEYVIFVAGENTVVGVEETEELARLWTYAEIYKAMKWK